MRAGSQYFLKSFFAFGVAVLLSACGSDSSKSLSQDQQAKIRQAMQAAMTEYNIPGMAVGVWSDEQGEFVESLGLGDVENNVPMNPRHHLRIGSITKSFISTLILQLADEGKLSLDDPIALYLPDFPNGENITVREVNNHTSGVPNYLFINDFYSISQEQNLTEWPPQHLLDLATSAPPLFSPGSSWMYSNTNFILSGLIIELVTGQPVEEAVKVKILDPLGLKNTEFPTEPDITPPLVHGYADPSRIVEGAFSDVDLNTPNGLLKDVSRLDPSAAWTAGAMTSNLYDLRHWAEALVSGKLLTAQGKAELLDFIAIPNFLGVKDFKYGFGVMSFAGFIGHGGEIFGYETLALHHPELKTTIVIELNNFPTDAIPAIEILEAILNALYGDAVSLSKHKEIYKSMILGRDDAQLIREAM